MAYDMEWLLDPADLAVARAAYFDHSLGDDELSRRLLAAYDAARRAHGEAVLHLQAGQMGILRRAMDQVGAIGAPGPVPGIPRAAVDTIGPTIVAPEEVRETLRRIDHADQAAIADAIRGYEPLWAHWLAWLRESELRGGFLSH